MVKVKTEKADVGIIVARFQTHELHEGHKQLLDFVSEKHELVVVVLGLSHLLTTQNNPLDLRARKQMINSVYPDIEVLYNKDQKSDEVWSKNLDRTIKDAIGNKTAILYGSRDSFIPHYKGSYPTIELEPSITTSATEVRNKIKSTTKPSSDFRAGVIWAAHNRYDTVFTTVDVAIINHSTNEILLGRKEYEDKWRLIGGFADITSNSFEEDARREVMEETRLEVGDIIYRFSQKIDDWRYRGERDGIKTLFFTAKYIYGKPVADDDIAEVRWFPIEKLDVQIVKEHKEMIDKAKKLNFL